MRFCGIFLWRLVLGQAPAAFDRFGDGECTTIAQLPVRGRSRRDMEHGECRAECDTDNCIGYSYAPCERICTLHGEPALFRGLPLPERWSTLNGGGAIARTDQRCGTSCYVRKAPCPAGTWSSARAKMNYESISYDSTQTLDCPLPYKGSVTILCGSTGVTLQSGRCLSFCESGTVRDDTFEVTYPPTVHGEYGVGECATGTKGNMTIFCNDGVATWVLGQCGINCPAASLRSGTAVLFPPVLDHEQTHTIACPLGWTGSVLVECINEDTSLIGGGCSQHCSAGVLNITVGAAPAAPVQGFLSFQALEHNRGVTRDCLHEDAMLTGRLLLWCNDGNVTPDYSLSEGCWRHCPAGHVGEGMRGVSHGVVPHGENRSLQCNPGYDGYFLINCWDGHVTHLEGFCYMDCITGTITSNTITLPHVAMKHGENTTVECPTETHTGNITVLCDDGQAKMVEGFCGENCSAGEYFSNGAIVKYPGIPHYVRLNVSCPAPWGDFIEFRCFDGSVRQSGRCGRQCLGGRLENNGASVFYTNLNHSQSGNFTCETFFAQSELSFSGQLTLSCFDGNIVSEGQCFPDCLAGEINNNGAKILVPLLKSEESIYTNCEPSQAYGMVTVSCLGGFQQVTAGSCGDPCPAGAFSNVNTRHTPIDLEEVWHDTGVWKDCPLDLSGRVYIRCFDRVLRALEGQCGERCMAQQVQTVGGNFNSPVLDHAETFLQPCLEPYSSHINLTCHFGTLEVTNNCQLACFAGSFTLPNGAVVPHPDLISGDTSSPACPPGFVGEVSVICVNGTMERHTGACNSHCDAGRFQGPTDYMVNHDRILYNDTSLVSCPLGFFGTLRLRCLGQVVIDEGECKRNCDAGVTLVREGLMMSYEALEHNAFSTEKPCPANQQYVGSIRFKCVDSLVSLHSGVCFKHCGNGQIQGATFNNLQHDAYERILCPEVGEIRIRCYDGVATVIDGECLYGCAAGSSLDRNGVPVQHPAFPHDTRVNGTCSQDGVGLVELYCNNTVVTAVGSQDCRRHCPPQTTMSRDGSNISTPYIEHLQSTSMLCPNNLTGLLGLRCSDHKTSIIDGICGDMNCAQGFVSSNGATVMTPAINDQRRAGPGSCGPGFIGEPVFECNNGQTSILTVNLIRQPRIPGVDNVSEIGSSYQFTEDDRFKLCGCCLPPPPLPEVDALLGADPLVVIYWAAAVGGGGLLVAVASGYWIHRQHAKKRMSKVQPAPVEFEAERMDQLALADETPNQLSLREEADASEGRQDSALTPAPMPQMLKPRRDGTNKEWQYW